MRDRSKDHRASLALLANCACASTPARFLSVLLPGVQDLLGADEITFSEVEADTLRVTRLWGYPTTPQSLPTQREIWYTQPGDHPWFDWYLRTRDVQPTRLSDLLTQTQLRRSAYYVDFFRPRGVEFALYTVVATPRTVAMLGASRSWSDFTEHERELLDALRSPLGVVWQHVAGAARPVPRVSADVFTPLTPAERRVAELVLDGHRNHVVASLLGLSVKAVEQHLTRVYRKLDITSRSQLIAQAFGRTPLSTDAADRR